VTPGDGAGRGICLAMACYLGATRRVVAPDFAYGY